MAFFNKRNNVVRYLLVNLRYTYFKLYKIPTYNIRLLKKLFRLQKILFNSTKLINFNKFKFNNINLNLRDLGLISLIEKLYNKKVEIDLVELKSIHLNSDVFSSAVALKLRDRKNKAVRILRKAILQMVRIPDLHTLITFDDRMEAINKNNIIDTIKQQIVSGVRFEASGRLTRRLTAMRAVFKYRYAGSLKNIRSSFNNKPSTMLRGYVKSNLQYSLINSKTRNGTFGLKGWVSSHGFSVVDLYLIPVCRINLSLALIIAFRCLIYYWGTLKACSIWEWTFKNPPKPHQFSSIQLKSSGLGSNTIDRLQEKKKVTLKELFEINADRKSILSEIKDAKHTLVLFNHVDDSVNNPLKNLKQSYPTFFDEDSHNTTKEGLNQLIEYLEGEYSGLSTGIRNGKKKLEQIDKKIAELEQLNKQSGESSNTNSIFIILTPPFQIFKYLGSFIKCALPYFSLLATIFSLLFFNFIFPSLDVPCFIQNIIDYTNHLMKYEIATSLPLLLWYFYSYGKKMNKMRNFIQTSYYIDIWVLLGIFTVIIFF